MPYKVSSDVLKYQKNFIVIEYCCDYMKDTLDFYPIWEIRSDGGISCGDYECGYEGKFCSECGEKIVMY